MPKSLHSCLLPALVGCLTLFALSCSTTESVIAPSTHHGLATLSSICVDSSVVVNDYEVVYEGRTFDGTSTTFTYSVIPTGEYYDAYYYFGLEIPECADSLVSYSPTGAAVVDTIAGAGFYGIEWSPYEDYGEVVPPALPGDGTNRLERRSYDGSAAPATYELGVYSYTFAGDVPQGFVRTSVEAGESIEVGEIPGPCKGFVLTGRVFVDTDSSGTLDPFENNGGIANVSVFVSEVEGCSQTVTTDSEGRYEILVGAGTYEISISGATPENDFNEELFDSFNSTSPLLVEVTVPPDPGDTNFGFKLDTEQIIEELKAGTTQTTGFSTKFWTKQIRWAIGEIGIPGQGKMKRKPTYTRTDILGFLETVQGYAFPDPFVFTPGNELQEALDILRERPQNDLNELLQEMLAFELNHAAGVGIVGNEGLQEVLIVHSESVYILNAVTESPGLAGLAGTSLENDVSTTKNMLQLINQRGGGGGPVQ